MMGVIRRTFKYLNKESFMPVYKYMVRSHLDYATPVWSP